MPESLRRKKGAARPSFSNHIVLMATSQARWFDGKPLGRSNGL
jgi:hypothetical protein